MQPETIEKLITPHTKALMINTPNNPTGSVMTRETMAKIAELAVKHDLLVISDDVYNTLLYAGEEAPCIASFPGMKERTVIVNSFSKSYAMTGWRIGFVAAPAEIVDRMTKCQENFNACANAPGQYAATVALDHPELCEELRQTFERRRSDPARRPRQDRRHPLQPPERRVLCLCRHQQLRPEQRRVLQPPARRAEGRLHSGQRLWRMRRGLHPYRIHLLG